MKFASIYSNIEEIFPKIYFKTGLNVIFAQVKDPKIMDRDSHNLGKTFLIQVIDFALLGDIDKMHPFKVHPDIFADLIFFIEIETVNGQFVTVKRSIKSNPISIHVGDQRNLDLKNVPESSWTYPQLSIAKAEKQLNDLLDLEVIIPFNYRKGLGYFLRRQSDYDEIFRISKFQYGPDKYWKPFVALLLGLEQELIVDKYSLDDDINSLDVKLSVLESEAGSKSDEFDEVRGLLEIRQAAAEKMRIELDAFSFREIEAQISETSVGIIEAEIAVLNEKRYTLDYELQEIEKSLEFEPKFDIHNIQKVFNEASVVLPESIIRSYEELVDFNNRMSIGRKERLQTLRGKLVLDREQIEQRIQTLDNQRQESLRILQDKQTFKKFKEIQRLLIEREREIGELKQRLSQLDKAASTQRDIDGKKVELSEKVTSIRKVVNKENQILTRIRRTFSDCVERVLRVEALLSVTVNQNGNLEFNVRTLDRDIAERETSEDQGTSYRKVLAACFDLSLLMVYSSNKFYRFVYHDGILEGLDNRRKVSWLNQVREACKNHGIQYILTVIDSDLPRDDSDQKLLFTEQEIVRYLHDKGDDGRLFRTRTF